MHTCEYRDLERRYGQASERLYSCVLHAQIALQATRVPTPDGPVSGASIKMATIYVHRQAHGAVKLGRSQNLPCLPSSAVPHPDGLVLAAGDEKVSTFWDNDRID